MKHLPWAIPLGVFVIMLAIMLIIVPYSIVKDQQEVIVKLQNAQAQKEHDTKQDIRTFLESINPAILQKIDTG